MKETNIYGYKTFYEDDAFGGVSYLANDLEREEAEVFFEQARLRGVAYFKTYRREPYTLVYRADGSFLVLRRA